MGKDAKAIIHGYKLELLAIQDTLDIIAGKWNMQVMALVCSGEFRYSELQVALNQITPKMLSRVLKDLEQNQLIVWREETGPPLRVTYTLSEYGHTMVPLIVELVNWGKAHRERMRGG